MSAEPKIRVQMGVSAISEFPYGLTLKLHERAISSIILELAALRWGLEAVFYRAEEHTGAGAEFGPKIQFQPHR